MNVDLSNTITFVKKYLLREYNWFIIDINDSFIGCKFHNDKYYIFFISVYEDKITFTYREDFTIKEVIRVPLPDDDNEILVSNLIDKAISLALERNEKIEEKRRLLKNSLVNYNYKQEDKNTFINKLNEAIKKEEKNNNKEMQNSLVSDNIKKEETEEKNAAHIEYELDIPLSNIEMSNRLKNGLLRSGYKTVGDFLSLNREQIGSIRHLGKKTIKEAEQLADELSRKNKINSLPMSDKQNIKISDDLIDRLYSQISIEECGFSVRLTNCLKNNKINNLAEFIRCPKEKLEKMESLGKKTYNEAIDYKVKIYKENIFGEDNSDFIMRVIKAIAGYKEISTIMLKNYLSNNTEYPVDNIINDINILRNNGLIEYTMNGIKIKRKKLEEALNELDLSSKMLIIERLNGKTLQEIGESRSITRERVRQKFTKEFAKIPMVDEDKYAPLFEKYNFSEEDFIKIFNEEKYVYNYLKEKYKSGELDIEDALKDERFNEPQKEIIRSSRRIAKLFGETVIINRQNIIYLLAKKYASKGINIEKFTELYNDFVNENEDYNLLPVDDRSMEGLLSRSDIAVFDIGRRFRYYDYNNISQEDYESLKEILFNMDSGYYSTLVIYKNNNELMNALDIRDEYELHNISKTLFNDKEQIVFERMPNFSIDGITKNEFIEEKIKEFAPISVSDFVDMLETEYGHKASTMMSHITSNFQKYIDNGIIKSNISILPDYEIEKIKYLLRKPIYNIDDLKELLISNNYNNIDEIITSPNMYKMGYRIRSSYICKKDIGSIEEYFKNLANENDFIANDNFLKNSTYSTMIKRVERSLDIFLISNEEYITIKKLNSLGITKKDIVDFCENVKEKFKDIEYFTLANIRDLLEIGKLDDYGFDDIFLENIIGNIDNITYVKFSNNKIFSFVNESIDSKKFVLDSIGNRISIFVDELQNELMEHYGIEVAPEKIKNAIIDTDMYYSDELSKIYQNKDYYYEEVFSYE